MTDMPNEETIYLCGDAMYNVLADYCLDGKKRGTLLETLCPVTLHRTPHDLADAPPEVNALFKELAYKCLLIGQTAGAEVGS